MTRKQHTENRERPGYALCGREMPRDHDHWSDADSCQACASRRLIPVVPTPPARRLPYATALRRPTMTTPRYLIRLTVVNRILTHDAASISSGLDYALDGFDPTTGPHPMSAEGADIGTVHAVEVMDREQDMARVRHWTGNQYRYAVRHRTAEVTREEIRALLEEARTARDDAQVYVCEAALEGDPIARVECARVIAEARAQEVRS